MSNDSSTGGPLVPGSSSPAIAQDDTFTDFITRWVGGITGIEGDLIRPRWQVNPPNQPTVSQSWLAIGVTDIEGDWDAWERHVPSQPTSNGSDLLQRTEELTLLCSFYGPAAQANSALLRDGLSVAQNRELLRPQNMSLVGVGKITSVPALINNQWYFRLDMSVTLRRYIVRVYPILNIESVNGTVVNEVEYDDLPETFPFNIPNN